MPVRAIRGATTVQADEPAEISQKVKELLSQMLKRNGVSHDDLISVIFTATHDIVSMFPAAAAREMGLGDVPLLCAREIPVTNSVPLCVRIMAHLESDRPRSALHHVYLHGAASLRDDLPE